MGGAQKEVEAEASMKTTKATELFETTRMLAKKIPKLIKSNSVQQAQRAIQQMQRLLEYAKKDVAAKIERKPESLAVLQKKALKLLEQQITNLEKIPEGADAAKLGRAAYTALKKGDFEKTIALLSCQILYFNAKTKEERGIAFDRTRKIFSAKPKDEVFAVSLAEVNARNNAHYLEGKRGEFSRKAREGFILAAELYAIGKKHEANYADTIAIGYQNLQSMSPRLRNQFRKTIKFLDNKFAALDKCRKKQDPTLAQMNGVEKKDAPAFWRKEKDLYNKKVKTIFDAHIIGLERQLRRHRRKSAMEVGKAAREMHEAAVTGVRADGTKLTKAERMLYFAASTNIYIAMQQEALYRGEKLNRTASMFRDAALRYSKVREGNMEDKEGTKKEADKAMASALAFGNAALAKKRFKQEKKKALAKLDKMKQDIWKLDVRIRNKEREVGGLATDNDGNRIFTDKVWLDEIKRQRAVVEKAENGDELAKATIDIRDQVRAQVQHANRVLLVREMIQRRKGMRTMLQNTYRNASKNRVALYSMEGGPEIYRNLMDSLRNSILQMDAIDLDSLLKTVQSGSDAGLKRDTMRFEAASRAFEGRRKNITAISDGIQQSAMAFGQAASLRQVNTDYAARFSAKARYFLDAARSFNDAMISAEKGTVLDPILVKGRFRGTQEGYRMYDVDLGKLEGIRHGKIYALDKKNRVFASFDYHIEGGRYVFHLSKKRGAVETPEKFVGDLLHDLKLLGHFNWKTGTGLMEKGFKETAGIGSGMLRKNLDTLSSEQLRAWKDLIKLKTSRRVSLSDLNKKQAYLDLLNQDLALLVSITASEAHDKKVNFYRANYTTLIRNVIEPNAILENEDALFALTQQIGSLKAGLERRNRAKITRMEKSLAAYRAKYTKLMDKVTALEKTAKGRKSAEYRRTYAYAQKISGRMDELEKKITALREITTPQIKRLEKRYAELQKVQAKLAKFHGRIEAGEPVRALTRFIKNQETRKTRMEEAYKIWQSTKIIAILAVGMIPGGQGLSLALWGADMASHMRATGKVDVGGLIMWGGSVATMGLSRFAKLSADMLERATYMNESARRIARLRTMVALSSEAARVVGMGSGIYGAGFGISMGVESFTALNKDSTPADIVGAILAGGMGFLPVIHWVKAQGQIQKAFEAQMRAEEFPAAAFEVKLAKALTYDEFIDVLKRRNPDLAVKIPEESFKYMRDKYLENPEGTLFGFMEGRVDALHWTSKTIENFYDAHPELKDMGYTLEQFKDLRKKYELFTGGKTFNEYLEPYLKVQAPKPAEAKPEPSLKPAEEAGRRHEAEVKAAVDFELKTREAAPRAERAKWRKNVQKQTEEWAETESPDALKSVAESRRQEVAAMETRITELKKLAKRQKKNGEKRSYKKTLEQVKELRKDIRLYKRTISVLEKAAKRRAPKIAPRPAEAPPEAVRDAVGRVFDALSLIEPERAGPIANKIRLLLAKYQTNRISFHDFWSSVFHELSGPASFERMFPSLRTISGSEIPLQTRAYLEMVVNLAVDVYRAMPGEGALAGISAQAELHIGGVTFDLVRQNLLNIFSKYEKATGITRRIGDVCIRDYMRFIAEAPERINARLKEEGFDARIDSAALGNSSDEAGFIVTARTKRARQRAEELISEELAQFNDYQKSVLAEIVKENPSIGPYIEKNFRKGRLRAGIHWEKITARRARKIARDGGSHKFIEDLFRKADSDQRVIKIGQILGRLKRTVRKNPVEDVNLTSQSTADFHKYQRLVKLGAEEGQPLRQIRDPQSGRMREVTTQDRVEECFGHINRNEMDVPNKIVQENDQVMLVSGQILFGEGAKGAQLKQRFLDASFAEGKMYGIIEQGQIGVSVANLASHAVGDQLFFIHSKAIVEARNNYARAHNIDPKNIEIIQTGNGPEFVVWIKGAKTAGHKPVLSNGQKTGFLDFYQAELNSMLNEGLAGTARGTVMPEVKRTALENGMNYLKYAYELGIAKNPHKGTKVQVVDYNAEVVGTANELNASMQKITRLTSKSGGVICQFLMDANIQKQDTWLAFRLYDAFGGKPRMDEFLKFMKDNKIRIRSETDLYTALRKWEGSDATVTRLMDSKFNEKLDAHYSDIPEGTAKRLMGLPEKGPSPGAPAREKAVGAREEKPSAKKAAPEPPQVRAKTAAVLVGPEGFKGGLEAQAPRVTKQEQQLVKTAQNQQKTLTDPESLFAFARRVASGESRAIALLKRMDPIAYGEVMKLANDPAFKSAVENAAKRKTSAKVLNDLRKTNPELHLSLKSKLDIASQTISGEAGVAAEAVSLAVGAEQAPVEARGRALGEAAQRPGETVAMSGAQGPSQARVDALARTIETGQRPQTQALELGYANRYSHEPPSTAARMALEDRIFNVGMELQHVADAWISGGTQRESARRYIMKLKSTTSPEYFNSWYEAFSYLITNGSEYIGATPQNRNSICFKFASNIVDEAGGIVKKIPEARAKALQDIADQVVYDGNTSNLAKIAKSLSPEEARAFSRIANAMAEAKKSGQRVDLRQDPNAYVRLLGDSVEKGAPAPKPAVFEPTRRTVDGLSAQLSETQRQQTELAERALGTLNPEDSIVIEIDRKRSRLSYSEFMETSDRVRNTNYNELSPKHQKMFPKMGYYKEQFIKLGLGRLGTREGEVYGDLDTTALSLQHQVNAGKRVMEAKQRLSEAENNRRTLSPRTEQDVVDRINNEYLAAKIEYDTAVKSWSDLQTYLKGKVAGEIHVPERAINIALKRAKDSLKRVGIDPSNAENLEVLLGKARDVRNKKITPKQAGLEPDQLAALNNLEAVLGRVQKVTKQSRSELLGLRRRAPAEMEPMEPGEVDRISREINRRIESQKSGTPELEKELQTQAYSPEIVGNARILERIKVEDRKRFPPEYGTALYYMIRKKISRSPKNIIEIAALVEKGKTRENIAKREGKEAGTPELEKELQTQASPPEIVEAARILERMMAGDKILFPKEYGVGFDILKSRNPADVISAAKTVISIRKRLQKSK